MVLSTAPETAGVQVLDAVRSELDAAGRDGMATDSLELRAAQYRFGQLASWRDAVFPQAFSTPGVRFLDLDERANRVTIGFESAINDAAVDEVLRDLDIPRDAVSLKITGAPRRDVTLHDRVRPVRGALRLTLVDEFGMNDRGCSLGFNVKSGGDLFLITNSHCTEEDGDPGIWNSGSRYPWGAYQRTESGSNFLGYEAYDPGPSTCYVLFECRESDAAAFEYLYSDSVGFAELARVTGTADYGWGGSGSETINSSDPYFEITGEDSYPSNGETMYKIGYGAGWTTGDVSVTCVDVEIYDDGVLLCSYGANYGRSGGDSGAPVFKWSGSGAEITIAGVHWGALVGDTVAYFSPLGGVEADLGSFSTFDPPLSAYIVGPNPVNGEDSCAWQAVASGGTPPYSYQWSGALSGTGSAVWGVVSSTSYLYVSVTDDDSDQDSAQFLVVVDEEADACPE